MIKRIKVNGYKSLESFSLVIKPGLNVLIGPNGAGKTNICQAFSLIGSLVSGNLEDFIASQGGSRNLLRKKSSDGSREISISCNGSASGKESSKVSVEVDYSYSVTICISEGNGLTITKENLSLLRDEEKIFDAKRSGDKCKVQIYNKDKIGPIRIKQLTEFDEAIDFKIGCNTESIFELLSIMLFVAHVVRTDLTRSRILNIDPKMARKEDDIGSTMRLRHDGRHLPNTLSFLKKDQKKFANIESILNNILRSTYIIEPSTTNDGFGRTLMLRDELGVKYGADVLSDGTIKAIALATALIYTNYGLLILEEPENYLHPWACEVLIEEIRNLAQDNSYLITTHSETILNKIKPGEIIVCEFKDGKTNANRLKNAASISKLIENTGFGCGYHYGTGGLGGV